MALTSTLAEANEKLTIWQAALDALATGKSYRIGERELTRQDQDFVLEMVQRYTDEVQRHTKNRPAGLRVRRVIPRAW